MKQPDFFTQEDLELLSKWRDRVYNKNNPKHKKVKKELMENVWTKTQYWAKELVKRIEGYETYNPRIWMERGWENGKRVSKFKKYTWARIFKKGDINKAIFFTVGASAKSKALVYKIDHYGVKESPLSAEQKMLCSQLIPDEVRYIQMPYEDIPTYNWKKLLDKTEQFIRENKILYNRILDAVWKNTANVPGLKNRLIKRELPKKGLNKIPKRKFNFKGHDTDWEKRQHDNSDRGKLGEDLVVEHEKDILRMKDLDKLAEKVNKVQDGKGYDILSKQEDGSDKYIEVKSTTGNENTPFEITPNEVEYSKKYRKSYYLYRVFNLKKKTRVAEYHEFHGNIKKYFLLEETQFKAHRKNRK